jgi:hypothetical protein
MKETMATPTSPRTRTCTSSPVLTRPYKKTSVFPDGTIFYKELQLTLPGQNPDGSRTEPSGRGEFPGAAAASHEGCSGRYGGCGVMIYWHVERGSVCIHSTEPLGSRVGSAPHHRLKSTKAFETSYSS